MTKVTITILLAFVHFSIFSQNYADSLHNKLTEIYESSGLPGFSVGIIDSTGLIFSKGYGFANKEKNILYSPENTQLLASISKTFIAVCVMQSIEDGLFSLQTPINNLLPFKVVNPNFPADTIRILHLVNHTSGLLDNTDKWKLEYSIDEIPDKKNYKFGPEEEEFFEGIAKTGEIELDEYLELCLDPKGEWYSTDLFADYKAGEQYNYSNIGADLCAYIIEIVQHKKYSLYVKENILEPLKMNTTGWRYNTPKPELAAETYSYYGFPYPKVIWNSYPSGFLESSVSDLSKFLKDMLLGTYGRGQLMSAEFYQQMFAPTFMVDEDESISVFWQHHHYLNDIMHDGSAADATTIFGFNSDKNIGYILLVNHGVYLENLGESYIKVWRSILKYRELLTRAKKP